MPHKDHLKNKQYQKEYYFRNRAKKLKARKLLYMNTPYDVRLAKNNQLKSTYKISIEEYEQKLKKQNYCCAICNRHRDEFKRNLSVDHDHKTGKVRSLLCIICNTNVGVVEDKLEMILKYLNKHRKDLN
jgi:23S rRNA G2445 N2-methylase RlmL